MMANCSDNVYVIKYTDKSKGTITITKSSLVTNLVDIALVGKSRLDYGEIFNENILHLLENFACPSSPDDDNAPDTSVAFGSLLRNPVDGQKWFNSTAKRLYVYNKTLEIWVPQAKQGDVAGNSGIIAHGEYLPRPTINGYVFPYDECNFVVSQHSNGSIANDDYIPQNTEIDYMRCFVSPDGRVTVQFRYRGESSLRNGYANYQIIGIRGEVNTPLISVTPYPVPNPTPGVSATTTPTPTPAATVTRTPATTPTRTPSVSVTTTPINSATPTPTVSVTKTPGVTATPTPTKSPTPTPTVSISKTPGASHTPTPTKSPTPTPTISVTPSSVYTINLDGIPTMIEHVSGIGSWASLDFNADGTWISKEKNTVTGTGVWASSGIGNNYEIMYTDGGGNFPQSGSPGVWYSLGSGFGFFVQDSGSTTEAYANITYTIRRKANHTDSKTRSVYMSADGECFAVGTKLSLSNGELKNVEDLMIGDKMASFTHPTMLDESDEKWRDWKTKDNDFTLSTSKVTAANRFYADGGIDINGIVTTKNHIHFVFDGEEYGWKNAKNVLLTDKLVDTDGNHVDILNITELSGPIEFVELDVETNDTLVVSSGDKLILGHNVSA